MFPSSNDFNVRKALMRDVRDIHKLVGYYADQGLLLPKSLSELYDHLRDYYVVEDINRTPTVIGTCALGICWEDLAEIRSLAVSGHQQKKGHGIRLVEVCLEEARQLGLKKVFALTYIPEFFVRFGFREVEKSILPHKIWADCLKCPHFPDCEEVAMILDL